MLTVERNGEHDNNNNVWTQIIKRKQYTSNIYIESSEMHSCMCVQYVYVKFEGDEMIQPMEIMHLIEPCCSEN